MNADGTGQMQLTHSGVTNDQVPDGSPDGRKIAYEEGDVGSGRIWVMNADGTHNQQLTTGPGDDFGTAWSPDGRQIAFVRDLGHGDRNVYLMNANGGHQHRVMELPLTQYVPAWLPLGSERATFGG
jgi:TolB protein